MESTKKEVAKLKQFFTEMLYLKEVCLSRTKQLQKASGATDGPQCIRIANTSLLQILSKENIIQQLKIWEEQKSSNAIFKSMINYLHLFEAIFFSTKADTVLHIEAGEALSKLFFVFNQIKYKWCWPRYIADMHELKTKHPATWKELEDGDIFLTKKIPFVSISSNYACEHLNSFILAYRKTGNFGE